MFTNFVLELTQSVLKFNFFTILLWNYDIMRFAINFNRRENELTTILIIVFLEHLVLASYKNIMNLATFTLKKNYRTNSLKLSHRFICKNKYLCHSKHKYQYLEIKSSLSRQNPSTIEWVTAILNPELSWFSWWPK